MSDAPTACDANKILHLKFDDPNDLGWDSSGRGNHAIVHSTVPGQPVHDTSFGGGSLRLQNENGEDEWIEVPHSGDFSFSQAITIAYWLRYDDIYRYNTFLGQQRIPGLVDTRATR